MSTVFAAARGLRRSAHVGTVGTMMACAALASFVLGLGACSPSSLVDTQSPSTVVDPSQVQNAAGAASIRNAEIVQLMYTLGAGSANLIANVGLLTDELASTRFTVSSPNDRNTLATTITKNQSGYSYDPIQSARILAQQGAQAVQLYGDNLTAPRAWQGEMQALEGYTIVWLAENYCSGIPLSRAPLVGPIVPTRGFTTEEMLTQAIALFDSATVTGADSAQFVNLALVGKARALLDLGQFAAADSAVQNVPDDFVYVVPSTTGSGYAFDFGGLYVPLGEYRAQDGEGTHGLVWSTDPRTGVVTQSQTGGMLWPAKYNYNPSSGKFDPATAQTSKPVRIADGLEARLIQAEAALATGSGAWLTILNRLRTNCIGTTPCAPVPGLTSASLPPLTDPGTPDARLDTVMTERAMWLYLTAHREGDLRRLAHVYGRNPDNLWPSGTISDPTFLPGVTIPGTDDGLPYGGDTVLGPDVNEKLRNPMYGGCSDTNP